MLPLDRMPELMYKNDSRVKRYLKMLPFIPHLCLRKANVILENMELKKKCIELIKTVLC